MAPFPDIPGESQMEMAGFITEASVVSNATDTPRTTGVTIAQDLMKVFAQNCSALLTASVTTTPAAPAAPEEAGVPSSAEPAGRYYLDEFQIVKAVVLATVTCIILVSICKMVFQLFVQYAVKSDDG